MSHHRLPLTRSYSLLTLALLASLIMPAASSAFIQQARVAPSQPTACDSVSFIVTGYFPDGCWHYDGYDVEILPIMRDQGQGPIGTVFRVRVLCHNDSAQVCPDVIVDYGIEHGVGLLPPGPYEVLVHEVDSFNSSVIYDTSNFSFTVRDTCGPPADCVMPGFVRSPEQCDVIVSPGRPGHLLVTLSNSMPVAGAEMIIDGFLQYRDAICGPGVRCGYNLRVTAVQPLLRAVDMGLEWTFSGDRLHLMFHPLSSLTGGGLGIIEPGEGPIARVQVETTAEAGDTSLPTVPFPELDFPVMLIPVAFADPNANSIPECPTFAPIMANICVRSDTKCDVNGDGRADVVDIVRMIQCIMCPIPEGCCSPEETRRGDCNGDGVLNVTDVICCIGHILDPGGTRWEYSGEPQGDEQAPTVGLSSDVIWEGGGLVTVPLEVSSSLDYGGVELRLSYDPTALVVENVVPAECAEGAELFYSASDGTLSMMLVAMGNEPISRGEGRLASVSFRTLAGGSSVGTTVSLVGVTGASAGAERLNFATDVESVELSPPSIPAAALASRPNPFANSAEISLSLVFPLHGSLNVFDASGRMVRCVFEGRLPAGLSRFEWDGKDFRGQKVPSGVYFLKFEGGEKSLTRKVVLLRR